MSRYGMIRETEADLIDRIIGLLKDRFGSVQFLEVGVCGGGTVSGVVRKCRELGIPVSASGVDFAAQKPNPPPLPDYDFHEGDSMDAWRGIKSRYNMAFIDACHCVVHSSQDFLNYSPFVVVGGVCFFHDTALRPGVSVQDTFPTDHSYAGKPPSVLGVREGLKKLGLLQGYRSDWKLIEEVKHEDGLMGVIAFEKLQEL